MVLSLLSLVCTSFILGAVNHTEPPILTIERREERKGERGRGEEEGGREGGRERGRKGISTMSWSVYFLFKHSLTTLIVNTALTLIR